ncbi:alpha/beta hydrolase fold protein [Caballeronia terrestris]|jgi:pimeloyl-ACP methyl ester carboxylesterase|uniref:Alpha/beta hydrolase fold protein n=1 Tax=Caballeronia terrestris TaxID=1226301 RepID=A0A158KTP7_9BURK|nr:alpha/beta hydrolase fold protein [Caballeronia terrestris]
MTDEISALRRRFLGTTIASIDAMQLGLSDIAFAQTAKPARASSTAGSAGIRQIDAGALNVGYAEAGPANGPVVILLHSWPYDIHSFADVTPLLVARGYRVIVPYLRGYVARRRFLSADTSRNGQQAVVAVDIVALMDALKIQQATFGAFDWSARTANLIAALWPERVKSMVSDSGYLIGSQKANEAPLPPKAEFAWWYQFYFDRAREGGLRGKSSRFQRAHLATGVAQMRLR